MVFVGFAEGVGETLDVAVGESVGVVRATPGIFTPDLPAKKAIPPTKRITRTISMGIKYFTLLILNYLDS